MFSPAVNSGTTLGTDDRIQLASITINARAGQHANTSKTRREDFQMATTKNYDRETHW